MSRCGEWGLVAGALLVALAARTEGLVAQGASWHLTATAAQSWFSGGLEDTTTAQADWSLAPTMAWGIAADRSFGAVRLGLGLSYLSSNLRLAGDGITITESTLAIAQWSVAALVTIPLVRLGAAGAAVSLAGGPVLGIWTLTGEETRTRAGGTAMVQLTAPLGEAWHLLALIGGSLSGSPFNPTELPAEFKTTSLWGSRAGFGVQYEF